MPTDVIPMTTGVFKRSPIRFYCAPGQSDGPVVQLGFIVELAVPNFRGLGLVARMDLNNFEQGLVGELGKRMLSGPYGYLAEEFDKAWDEGLPGKALEYLTDRHRHSIRFELPECQSVPQRLFVGGQPVRSLMLGFLVEALEEASFSLNPLQEADFAGESLAPQTGILTEAA